MPSGRAPRRRTWYGSTSAAVPPCSGNISAEPGLRGRRAAMSRCERTGKRAAACAPRGKGGGHGPPPASYSGDADRRTGLAFGLPRPAPLKRQSRGSFVPKPSDHVGCQDYPLPDLGSAVHQHPLASAAGRRQTWQLSLRALVRPGAQADAKSKPSECPQAKPDNRHVRRCF
jgi:hypothetical protein